MLYNISYNVAAIGVLVLCAVFYHARSNIQSSEGRWLLILIIDELAACAFNIAAALMNSIPGRYPLELRQLIQTLYLLFHTFTAPAACWYYLTLLRLVSGWKKGRKVLFALPYIFLCAVPLLLPPLQRLIFYYNGRQEYTHGPLVMMIYISSFMYAFLIIYMSIAHMDLMAAYYSKPCLAALLLTVGSIVFQSWFRPDLLINEYFMAIGTLLMQLRIDSVEWIHSLTPHTFNRRKFREDMAECFEEHISATVIVINISGTAAYRCGMADKKGFIELIENISGYQNRAVPFRKSRVYSLGNACFALTLCADKRQDADRIIRRLDERFSKSWEDPATGAQWRLPVRIIKIEIPETVEKLTELTLLVNSPFFGQDEKNVIIEGEQIRQLLRRLETLDESEGVPQTSEPGNSSETQFPPELDAMLLEFQANAENLTPAEARIALYYLNGYEVSEIPELAGISINTVKKHNKNVYRKMKVSSKEELVLIFDLIQRCGRLEKLEGLLNEKIILREENPIDTEKKRARKREMLCYPRVGHRNIKPTWGYFYDQKFFLFQFTETLQDFGRFCKKVSLMIFELFSKISLSGNRDGSFFRRSHVLKMLCGG